MAPRRPPSTAHIAASFPPAATLRRPAVRRSSGSRCAVDQRRPASWRTPRLSAAERPPTGEDERLHKPIRERAARCTAPPPRVEPRRQHSPQALADVEMPSRDMASRAPAERPNYSCSSSVRETPRRRRPASPTPVATGSSTSARAAAPAIPMASRRALVQNSVEGVADGRARATRHVHARWRARRSASSSSIAPACSRRRCLSASIPAFTRAKRRPSADALKPSRLNRAGHAAGAEERELGEAEGVIEYSSAGQAAPAAAPAPAYMSSQYVLVPNLPDHQRRRAPPAADKKRLEIGRPTARPAGRPSWMATESASAVPADYSAPAAAALWPA